MEKPEKTSIAVQKPFLNNAATNTLTKIAAMTRDALHDFITTNVFDLRPSQNALSIPVIIRIYHRMLRVIKFAPLKVEGNVIRDGHHRYIAARLANYKFETVPYRAPNPPDNWSSIQLELVDWDICQENNDKLDAKDAQYNSMTIEELRKRLK